MALPNEIQSGRLNAILHKLLNMSEGSPSPSLATDVFPVISLEADRPEWHFLGGGKLCSGWGQKAAAVGEYGTVSLWNPASSGILVVLESVMLFTSGATSYRLHPLAADPSLTAASTRYVRDLRLVDVTGSFYVRSTAQIQYGDASPVTPSVGQAYSPGNTNITYNQAWVLAPGTGLMVRSVTANVSLTVTFSWRERFLEPSESR